MFRVLRDRGLDDDDWGQSGEWVLGYGDEFPRSLRADGSPGTPPPHAPFYRIDTGVLYRYDSAGWTNLTDPPAATFNVKTAGAKVDGTDNTGLLQALIASVPNYSTIYFPAGNYLISSTLDFGTKVLHLIGDHQGKPGSLTSGGSVLYGTINGPLIKTNTLTTSGVVVERLGLYNLHATGTGITITGVVMALRDLAIRAYTGIDARLNTFTLLIENVMVIPATAFAAGSVGIYASSHTQIISCDVVNFDNGIRAWGSAVNIQACRLEVNLTGMVLGLDDTGAVHQLTRSSISGCSFEANDTALDIRSMSACRIAALGMQGSVNSPSAQSKVGMVVANSTYCMFDSIIANLSYSIVAIRIKGTCGISLKNVNAANTFTGAQVWDVQTNLLNMSFEGCNYTQRPDDVPVAFGIDYQRGVTTHTIRQVDHLTPAVEGKNMRGLNVAVAEAATSVAVAFMGAHTSGQALINTAAAAAGGSLAANTYYYIASLATPRGETGAVTEKSVVVGGPNGTVNITFFGFTADGWKRRIYRGTVTGVYDGYFEHTLNSSATFSDTGQAFTGLKSPPVTGQDTETTMQEPDANYAVQVTPNWGTTAWVTSKATTGFTINFGTQAPASATVDWFIVR